MAAGAAAWGLLFAAGGALAGDPTRAAGALGWFLRLGWPLWAAGWCVSAWMLWNRDAGPARRAVAMHGALAAPLLAAALLSPPVLSDDAYRYVWEGRVWLAGGNPFVQAPDDPSLADLAARSPDAHPFVNNPSLPTIYPPLAQGVFLLNALAGGGVALLSLALAAMAVGAAALFHAFLARRGLPTARALLLLGHPLLQIEVGFGRHLEPLVLLGACLLFWAAADRRGARPLALGAVGLAVAVLAKLAPLAFVLHAGRSFGGPRRVAVFAGAVGAIVLAGYAPLAGTGSQLFATLGDYNRNWEFNAALHRPLKAAWEAADPTGERITAALDAVGGVVGIEGLSLRLRDSASFDPIPEAQLAARLSAAALFAAAWLAALLVRAPIERRWLWVFGAALALSPVCHPWYALVLLPAAFGGGWAAWPAHWWMLSIPLSYAVLPGYWVAGEWTESSAALWIQHIGLVLAACAGIAWTIPRRKGMDDGAEQ